MNWIKLGGYLLIIVPTLFVGIVIGFYLIQDYMIFLGEKLPADHKFIFKNTFRELNFDLPSGNKINALLFTCDNPKGLIYYHHGNAGNLQGWGRYGVHFVRNGYDVLFYDYRGYGKSTGRISKQGALHDDAEFILRKISDFGHYEKVIYYGTSLGSGIAAKLAVDHPPDALIMETPYYNFCDLINFHYPFLPTKLMTKYKITTDKYVKKLKCPILLFHGTNDDVIPYSSSVRLRDLNPNAKLVTLKNGVHNNLSEFDLYQKELSSFLSSF